MANSVPHPGVRIKLDVIPKGMSVTKAAELVGVGRPALSNLLNGNSSLSSEMAARLEKAFQCPLKDLMQMQAAYDAAQASMKEAPAETTAYVPPFLKIKANDIERWASHNIQSRSRFPVLLRTLVNSTGRGLMKVDFPGNDDAERSGWDGVVESTQGSPWVPSGQSGWEFGVNDAPSAKVEKDFTKSVKAYKTENQCADVAFVFVTPRRWPGKTAWVAKQQDKGIWREVRAYDSSDLEQWLEQSLSGQTWFANETEMPAMHVRSLDKCWADWADTSAPPLTGTLFNTAIEASKRVVQSRLSQPAIGPIQIAADSPEEAIAFLAQLFSARGGDELASHRDRVLVFDKPGVLPHVAGLRPTFIAVASTREVERELAPHAKSMHSFVIYPRNSATVTPDVILEPANYPTFVQALEEMGKSRDEISRLNNNSGRSLTVLRRQLSTVPAVRVPVWASDHQAARSLVPFLLVGAWNSQNDTDKIELVRLAGAQMHDDVEREFQRLTQFNDAPVWSVGRYRGVVSKIDLLYSIAHAVTPDDLRNYFAMARTVLGEDDPALDLAEENRWAASMYGKARDFSSAFRDGCSETLILMATQGAALFDSRLGVDIEGEVISLVRDLLPTPLTTRILAANDRDLPTYAEAAPEEFLSIIERDLASIDAACLGLLRPTDSRVFGSHPSRTGLLWALEGLCWNPETLPRAAHILARLSQVSIRDNWFNKPINSLKAIFRAWMPQTAADLGDRVNLMKSIVVKFPDVAWTLCVEEINTRLRIGHYSHKPRWRHDGFGFGEPLTSSIPVKEFLREMIDLSLSWQSYSRSMVCDLVEHMQDLTAADQNRLWELIRNWATTAADDGEKAAVHEKIRVSVLSRRAVIRARKSGRTTKASAAATQALIALEPDDILNKYSWLFKDGWIEESADELADMESLDFEKRDERIKKQRTIALQEIVHQRGVAGILEFAQKVAAPWMVGSLASSVLSSDKEIEKLLCLTLTQILAGTEQMHAHKSLFGGLLHALATDSRLAAALDTVSASLSEEDRLQMLVLAPFGKVTWATVDSLSVMMRAQYWLQAAPFWLREDDGASHEAIEQLLKARRPRAAFSCVKHDLRKIDPPVLFRLLSEMAQGGDEKAGQYLLEPYYIEQAFKYLNEHGAFSLDELATLEFAYVEVLAQPWGDGGHGIPNLERYVENHPDLFTQAITWTYKRSDGAVDTPDSKISPELAKGMAERGFRVLESIKRIPGHDEMGELRAENLGKWIATVRQACAELGRAEDADICIGKMLSHAAIGADGVWPCEAVRDVLEDIRSEAVMRGTSNGVYNARGIHERGDGGSQERELEKKYRTWARALQTSHPFVASMLLRSLAKTYESEAKREDTEAVIRARLG